MTRPTCLSAAAIALTAIPSGLAQCDITRLVDPVRGPNDFFGFFVAVSGDWAVIGEPQFANNLGGSSFFAHRSQNAWSITQEVPNQTPAKEENFGQSVAIDGEWAVVGCPGDTNQFGNNIGSALILHLEGDTWVKYDTLLADSPEQYAGFGSSVGIRGEYILVGAPNENAKSGAAYVFHHEQVGWFLQQRLDDGGIPFEYFGSIVAIDDDRLAIAATRYKGFGLPGGVFLYQRNLDSWDYEAQVIGDQSEEGDDAGSAIALQGGILVMGAPYDNADGMGVGAAYVFSSLNNWGQVARLASPAPTINQGFGRSVSIDYPFALVGAWQADGNAQTSGAVFAFRDDGSDWPLFIQANSPDGAPQDHFGSSIATDDTTIIVGAQTDDWDGQVSYGSAYVFSADTQDVTYTIDPTPIELTADLPGLGEGSAQAHLHGTVGLTLGYQCDALVSVVINDINLQAVEPEITIEGLGYYVTFENLTIDMGHGLGNPGNPVEPESGCCFTEPDCSLQIGGHCTYDVLGFKDDFSLDDRDPTIWELDGTFPRAGGEFDLSFDHLHTLDLGLGQFNPTLRVVGTLPGFPKNGCYADLDGSGSLDLFDFLAFVNLFNAADAKADCDDSGALDLFDFLCFVNAFNAGC